jgi:hypothetical protein
METGCFTWLQGYIGDEDGVQQEIAEVAENKEED